MSQWSVDVHTNFDERCVEFEFTGAGLQHIVQLHPRQALFVAQMLIEKSLNVLEQQEEGGEV